MPITILGKHLLYDVENTTRDYFQKPHKSDKNF